ncbi:MAG: hypothetical protein MUF34_19965 [Polyangiaceae bacterium]|nr:hypothetical protein [Polyangiaceae bacterium]
MFDFASADYATEFALANAKKVVNPCTELRASLWHAEAQARQQALAAEKVETLRQAQAARGLEARGDQAQAARGRGLEAPGGQAEPARLRSVDLRPQALPARQQARAAGEEDFRRCLVGVEGGQTPAARRAALLAGQRLLEGRPDLCHRLFVEASRVEVEAALAKAKGVTTLGAKRRVVVTVLEELRGDGSVDEVRAKQISWLEAALAELERADRAERYDIRPA